MHETSTDPRTSPNQGADQEGSTGQASVQIHVASNDLMANLVGDHDSLLRRIEATFPEVQIHIRGNQVN